MSDNNKQREEKYPELFNHLKTMKGITEEEREKCLDDFYNMDEERAEIWDVADLEIAFWWHETINGSDFWEYICLNHNKTSGNMEN
jgi:hypothetical protein